MGLGGFLYFGPSPTAWLVTATARAEIPLARLPVNPFKNRRILASAALRRGDDFGMVPPI
jgi:hypothetical protein